MKISVIITIFNEAEHIEKLLNALASQTRLPDEIVITDAASTDNTRKIIKNFQKQSQLDIIVLNKIGNRSGGRNYAIKHAQYDWIAITDAGCIPNSDWLEKLEVCQQKSEALVIAGNQIGLAQTPFEEAVVPYVLVMQDKIDDTYLPATRSVLLHKKLWEKMGGFDEKLTVSEDYSFFKKVKESCVEIAVCKEAIIQWIPRKNIFQYFSMIYSFAHGDVLAGVFRKKVLFIFARYLVAITFIITAFLTHNYRMIHIIIVGVLLYILWSIKKNKRYVSRGWYWLPVLQVVADVAVMFGTLNGLFLIKIAREKN